MSKVLKVIGAIAGVVAIVAGAISTFGIGTVAFAALAGKIAAIAGVVAGVATLGSQLLARPPNARGSVNSLLIGSNMPSPYVMGTTLAPGTLVHDTGWGGSVAKVDNPYRFMAIVLSVCGPIGGYVSTLADFTPVTFTAGAADGYFNGFLWRDAQLGARPEADALAPHWAGAPDWGADYKLSGMAAVGWSLKFDKDGKRFASGVPGLGEIIQGVRVYDPRLDSTYPGGAGAQRVSDEATWAWSHSPALHALTYAYGRQVNGKWVFGVDAQYEAIDVAAFVAWANVCEANGWKVGGTIYEPGDSWDNLKKICQAGSAEPTIVGGVLSVKYDAPRVAIDVVTEDDLADGDVSLRDDQPWKQRINTCVPAYRSADHQWDHVQSAAVIDADAVEEDGEDKIEERKLDLVQDKDQGAQIAGYIVANARENGPYVLPLKPRMMRYRIGNVLTLNLPSLDLDGVDALITGWSIDPATGIVTMTFYTETATKHAWALGQSGTAPAIKTIVTSEQRDGVLATNVLPIGQLETLIQNSVPIGLVLTSADAGGGTATIVISDHIRRYADRDVAITGTTLTGPDNATDYFVYYDDATRADTTPAFAVTEIDGEARLSVANPARHYVGAITTQTVGGTGTTGGTGSGAPGGGIIQQP